MKILEDKILKDGVVIDNSILKVDSFFNYQIDIKILKSVAKYIASHFKNVDKVLTIEASGIAFAVAVSYELNNVPVVFAKKSRTAVNKSDSIYTAKVHSFTHGNDNTIVVTKRFINKGENILIIDDFMAAGEASLGLIKIVKKAKANVVGIGVGIEKEFQGARKKLNKLGYKVISAARIKEFKDNKVVFTKEK